MMIFSTEYNGDEIWDTSLPSLANDYQLYIDDSTLIPGRHTKTYFLQSDGLHLGHAHHV
jgi:hypothetical protein